MPWAQSQIRRPLTKINVQKYWCSVSTFYLQSCYQALILKVGLLQHLLSIYLCVDWVAPTRAAPPLENVGAAASRKRFGGAAEGSRTQPTVRTITPPFKYLGCKLWPNRYRSSDMVTTDSLLVKPYQSVK